MWKKLLLITKTVYTILGLIIRQNNERIFYKKKSAIKLKHHGK